MKFFSKTTNFGRIGYLSDLPKPWSNTKFRTPAIMTYTRGGTVPHLTFNTLQKLEEQNMMLLQTLPSVAEYKEVVEAEGKGLSSFVGLPEYPFHVSIQDPGNLTPTGYNINKGVSVWCQMGKKLLTISEFMQTIKAFKPVSYQALTDSDTPKNCSKKRLNKAVDNSLRFLDECLEEHKNCKELNEVAIFATVQGGYDSFLRKKSALDVSTRDVDGYVIDGFHVNGPDVENVDTIKMEEILREVFAILPEDKPRILHGAFDSETMLKAIKCGIDVFDSSYADRLSESGEANVFPIDAIPGYFVTDTVDSPPKRSKYTSKLMLKESLYKEDFEPILQSCSCYTCKHYTKAYIHHLLVTSELLAQILLMIHNMHHLSVFFKQIQNSMDS